jgi:hypothetical protein
MVREKLARAQAVLVLGLDDENRSVYVDRAWLEPGEADTAAFELASKYRKSYIGRLILTSTELRELADSLDQDTPAKVKSGLLDTAAAYRDLLCEDCFQELASECSVCPQLRMEAAREVHG